MSETRFTKGAWRPEDGTGQYMWEVCADTPRGKRKVVARIASGIDNRRHDAHLIAAAPDLYAALARTILAIETAAVYTQQTGFMTTFRPVIDEARAALAKARGEQS